MAKIHRLYAGALSFIFAETLAGSFPFWIINAWAWIMTYPLYAFHLIFFTGLAIKTNKKSIQHLYFWGVLFGWYESWLTKVIWAGYAHDNVYVADLSVMHFGVSETLVLTLFWHPIISYLMPLRIATALFASDQQTEQVFPGLVKFFNKWVVSAIFVVGTITMAVNLQNLIMLLATTIPSLIILGIGVSFIKKEQPDLLNVFTLKKKGWIITITYLILLYVIMFMFIFPELIPPITTLLATALIYIIIVLLILKIPGNETIQIEDKDQRLLFFKQFTFAVIIAGILQLIPSIAFGLFIFVVLLETLLAIFIPVFVLRIKNG